MAEKVMKNGISIPNGINELELLTYLLSIDEALEQSDEFVGDSHLIFATVRKNPHRSTDNRHLSQDYQSYGEKIGI